MNNLLFLNQNKHWLKMLHDLEQNEILCKVEQRGHPRFSVRLLSRLSGLAMRFTEIPNQKLEHLHHNASTLWAKNRFASRSLATDMYFEGLKSFQSKKPAQKRNRLSPKISNKLLRSLSTSSETLIMQDLHDTGIKIKDKLSPYQAGETQMDVTQFKSQSDINLEGITILRPKSRLH